MVPRIDLLQHESDVGAAYVTEKDCRQSGSLLLLLDNLDRKSGCVAYLLLQGDLLLLFLLLLISHLIAILEILLCLVALLAREQVRGANNGQAAEGAEYNGFDVRVHFPSKDMILDD